MGKSEKLFAYVDIVVSVSPFGKLREFYEWKFMNVPRNNNHASRADCVVEYGGWNARG